MPLEARRILLLDEHQDILSKLVMEHSEKVLGLREEALRKALLYSLAGVRLQVTEKVDHTTGTHTWSFQRLPLDKHQHTP